VLKIEPPDYRFCPFCGKKLGVRTEEKRKRRYCEDCRWTYYPHVGASAGAVIVKNGKVLMVKRNIEPYKGTWMFPAGFVDFGEHPEETLKREVKEETGLRVENYQLIGVFQSTDDLRSLGHFVFFFMVKAKSGEIKTGGENSAIAWQEMADPPKIGWQLHKKMMRMLRVGDILIEDKNS
jgi:ADP-ribose pyrophosphatase YjhB (NUDIX family)